MEYDCEHEMREMSKRVEKLEGAFIRGDYDGHKREHELFLRQVEAKERLASAVREKTISGLVWAGMLGLGTGAWHLIRDFVGR